MANQTLGPALKEPFRRDGRGRNGSFRTEQPKNNHDPGLRFAPARALRTAPLGPKKRFAEPTGFVILNPLDPIPEPESMVLNVEPIPAGMLIALKMWKWYFFCVVVPFVILISCAIPPVVIISLPAMLAIDHAWQRHKNRWELLDLYWAFSIVSFVLGTLHLGLAFFFLWLCFRESRLNGITIGIATLPNLIGCWLIVAAEFGWRFDKEYRQWLARQKQHLSDWEKRYAGVG